MVVDKAIWIGLGIVVALYLMYKTFFGRVKLETDFDKDYNKVLSSDEYKVKGQYDK